MKPGASRALVASGAGLVLALAFVFAYLLPRLASNRDLLTQIQTLEGSRSELSTLLGQASFYGRDLPRPGPDVPGWIAANALSGMERKLVSNDPFRKGQGAQVKLRNLPPEQVALFLGQLTRVQLMVKRLVLQDWDGNGNWEVEVFVEIPEGTAAP